MRKKADKKGTVYTVEISPEMNEKLKKHKDKTGCSQKFFVHKALDNEFKRIELELPEPSL